ncbi:MAG: sigma-54-dependent Fis family transcriptional regulator [Planctomycetes bacterium]|nr:sigma-54-dependent Fis family transcriptional regulator [Planctomycetota bacterium]
MLENSNPVNGGTADSERTAFDQLNEAFAVRVGLVGESPALRTLFERVRKLADSHVAVLIVGETGTGKESVARALHHNSARARGPFIAEGCATLSASLFAQRLFGHARGAFTGAVATASGLLDRADGGTLFLDEISDLALDAQGVLLRALSCGEYRALGSSETRRSDFRVIASTHCDIPALVRMGQFRHDLYWRLRGAILRVPPLRERRSDIEDLARQVHRELHLRTRRPLPPLSHDAIEALKAHSWPGNVLELRQELMQAWATADGESLGPSAFQFECLENVGPRSASAARGPRAQLQDLLGDAEARSIRDAMRLASGNKAEAARRLGVTRRSLYRRLEKLDALESARHAPEANGHEPMQTGLTAGTDPIGRSGDIDPRSSGCEPSSASPN